MIFEWIRDEIQIAYQFGISVQVDGVYYAPKDFRDLYHVVEDANYMKDFIDDGKGKIVQINFDKVKLK